MTRVDKHMSTKTNVSHTTLLFHVRQFSAIARRKIYQDTMPLHLTNGNAPCFPKFIVLLHSKFGLETIYFT